MIQRAAEVLPEGCVRSGIICREQQGKQIDQCRSARGTNKYTEHKGHTDGQLAVRNQKCDWRRMGQHKSAEHRNHKRVSAVFQKFVDPELKTAVQSELRSENLVLRKDQEKNSYRNTQESQRFCVCGLRIRNGFHFRPEK